MRINSQLQNTGYSSSYKTGYHSGYHTTQFVAPTQRQVCFEEGQLPAGLFAMQILEKKYEEVKVQPTREYIQ